MVTATKNRPASRPALLVNKTHLPHELDQGLGARLRIGLIELATDQTSEHEFRRIFALPGVDFYESRIWNDATITPETLARMETDVEGGMRVIMPNLRIDVAGFTCTSGAMVIGEDKVFALMHKARPGIPCSSPITGAIAGMKALGLERIALLTPYVQSINDMMRDYIEERGVSVPVMGSFNNANDDEVARITLEFDQGGGDRSGALAACRWHLRLVHLDPHHRHHPRGRGRHRQADARLQPGASLASPPPRRRQGLPAAVGTSVHRVIWTKHSTAALCLHLPICGRRASICGEIAMGDACYAPAGG